MTVINEWPRSSEALIRSKKSLAGGVSTGARRSMQPLPVFFDHGSGSQLWDIDGNQYTDYVLGWGPIIAGHSHPKILAAVGAQLQKGQDYGANHVLEYEVAEKLLSLIPGAERVLWSNTGTEANQVALRFARAATGRQTVVKFAGHYHGWQDSVLVSTSEAGASTAREPVLGSRGQSTAAASDVRVAQWNDIDSVRRILQDSDDQIAAVLLEPVLCNNGVIAPVPGFLEQLRELCTATGTVLIFDEVVTGFRMALGGAGEMFGVTPDLATYAKALAGGFSLSAVAGRADILDQIGAGVLHSGTYNGNPIVLAAAGAVLDILSETRPHQAMTERAATLAAGFRAHLASRDIVGTAHHVGPVVQAAIGVPGITTFAEHQSADWKAYERLTGELMRRGQFPLPGGRWYLSTEHSDEDVEKTIADFGDALTAAF